MSDPIADFIKKKRGKVDEYREKIESMLNDPEKYDWAEEFLTSVYDQIQERDSISDSQMASVDRSSMLYMIENTELTDEEKLMRPEELLAHRRRQDAGATSAKLADLEKAAKEQHVKQIEEVSRKIEELLIENEITWGEFQTIIDAYSQRTFVALNGMTVKSLKDLYDNPIIRL